MQQEATAEEQAEEPAQQEAEAAPEPASEQTTNTNGAPAEYKGGMTLTIRDEDGAEKEAMVVGRVRTVNKNGKLEYEKDENGGIVQYVMDGEVHRDRIQDLNEKVVGYTANEEEQQAAQTDHASNAPSQYKQGDRFMVSDGRNTFEAEIIAEENEDGLLTMQFDGNGGTFVKRVSPTDLNALIDTYISQLAEVSEPTTPQPVQQKYKKGDIFKIYDGEEAYEAKVVDSPNEEGLIPVRVKGKEGDYIQMFAPQTLDELTAPLEKITVEQSTAETPAAQTGQTSASQAQQAADNVATPAALTHTEAGSNLPTTEQSAETTKAENENVIGELSPIPVEKNKKGKVVRMLYHKVPIQRTLEDLYDGAMDQAEIDQYVDKYIANSQKRLDELQNKKIDVGMNKQAYLEDKKRHEADIAEAQAELDYYEKLKQEVQRITQRDARNEPTTEPTSNEPLTLEEVAANFAATHKVTPESLKAETGMAGRELNGYVGLVAKAENGGVSIERMAEMLTESQDWDKLGGTTDMMQDARNMLIEAFRTGNPRSYAKKQRQRYAEREQESELQEIERYAWQAYHMTAEEFLAYEEQSLPAIIQKYAGFDFEKYYASLCEQAEQMARVSETNNTSQQPTNNPTNNGQPTESTADGGSSQVLPRKESNDKPRETDGGQPAAGQPEGTGNDGLQSPVSQGTLGEREQGGAQTKGNVRIDDGRGGDGSPAGRQQSDLAQTEITAPISDETNEFGKPFVLSSDGTTTFGSIQEDSGLKSAPIKLSLGENSVDKNGENHGYGLLHIEAGHGKQILDAGFSSVEEFVETVAKNWNTIREGGIIAGNQTYLLEISDEHNNTLFIQLSRDGNYWNINSAGIFKKKYSRRKPEVFTRPALKTGTNTDSSGVNSGQSNGVTAPAGNSPQTSASKGNQNKPQSETKQTETAESLPNNISEQEEANNPSTENNKGTVSNDNQGNPLNEDGSLKLEKVSSVDDLTDEDFSAPTRNVELPKLPENVDAAIGAHGKPVIIKKNIFEKNWSNHKFPFEESRKILKSALYNTDLVGQTQPSKKPLHWVAIKLDNKSPIVILEVNENKDNTEIVGWYILDKRNLERIKRQATKNGGELIVLSPKDKVESLPTPLSDLSSASKVGENYGNGKGKSEKVDDYVSMAERIAMENEAKRVSSHFPIETREEAAAFDRRVHEMSDLELLAYIKADGNGDVNKAHHPNVYDEYDYRHEDEIDDAHDRYLQQLQDSNTTLEQAQERLGNIWKDLSPFATEERAELLGQEEALLDYIRELKKGKAPATSSAESLTQNISNQVKAAEAETNTNPTEAQKQAGNYKKGHLKIDGFDVSIENPKGSVRRGTDASGKQWEQTMHNTYGYLRGTEGVDGDHIDVFLSDNPEHGDVFVVDQVNKDGTFDEHKVMYGFPTEESARQAYLANYEDGWQGLGAITRVSREEFKKWVQSSHRKTKPFAEYKGVKTNQTNTELPTHKAFTRYNNNEAGTIAMVSGDSKRGYLVRYWTADANIDEEFAIGEQMLTPEEFAERLKSGKLTLATSEIRQQTPATENQDISHKTADAEQKTTETQEKQTQNADKASKPAEKIEDAGEKIGGARKDIARSMADKINLKGETFSTIFKKFDLRKLVEQGLDAKLAAGFKFIYEHAKSKFKGKKKIDEIRFIANYAKGYLLGDTSVDYSDNGWIFTDYGKRLFELNTELYGRLHDEFGDELFDVDLSGCYINVAGKQNGYTYFRNGEEINMHYNVCIGRNNKLFTAEEREDALNYFIEGVKESVSYKKSHPYELSVYRERGKDKSYFVATKIRGEIVPLTPKGEMYDFKYIKEHNAELQAEACRIEEQKKEERKNAPKEKRAEIEKISVHDKNGYGYVWATKIGKEVHHVSEVFYNDKETFRPNKEALEAAKAQAQENADALLQEYEERRKWKPEMNLGGIRSRVGVDYRQGKHATTEEILSTFGFRGIEFGNYVSQKERQKYLDECYDALMDMSAILGISPRAISLNGKLALAIGARGLGKASAHYEPQRNVINLTKKSGAGALAHEWWHAMDYYFGKDLEPGTEKVFADTTREEVRKAMEGVSDIIKGSEYVKRSKALDEYTNKEYYAKATELAARAFQDYIVKRLIERGQVNDFLSHFTLANDWNGRMEMYPYPLESDAAKINEAFSALFDTLREREENGTTILYQKADAAETVSKQEAALRDAIVEIPRMAGMEVFTDAEEGQRAIDAENGRVKMMGSRVDKRMSDVGAYFDARKLSDNERTVVDVFRGNADNKPISVNRDGKQHNVVMRQGHDEKAGTKHSLYRHYGTSVGTITAKDLQIIPDVIERGEVKDDGKKRVYRLSNDGVRYTVLTEINNGREEFCDFYSNRKGGDTSSSNTQTSARDYDVTTNSDAKVHEKSDTSKSNDAKLQKSVPSENDVHKKQQQLQIINDTNPAPDDYHTWVRSTDDILTLGEAVDEALREDPSYNLSSYPDVSDEMIRKALQTGRITIYSSNPIKNGAFVTPSLMQAQDYAGHGKVYSAEVNTSDVAWINTDEGMFASTSNAQPTSGGSTIRFFRTKDGHAYGFVKDGKIYIDPRIARADTPIHEYTHLWAEAFRRVNPDGWKDIVRLMNGTDLWEQVRRQYPELTAQDELSEEVLAHYSGRRGAEHLRAEQEHILKGDADIVEKAAAVSAIQRVKEALSKFWRGVADWLGLRFTTAEEVADRVLADMLHGVNPAKVARSEGKRLRMEQNEDEAQILARAKADGTYLKAPNGKPSRLNPQQWVQVRTRAFREWFGDWEKGVDCSKVVDENGEPLVVYHGTLAKELTKFDPEMVGSRYSYDEKGFFFTSSRNIAHDYASSEFDSSRKGNVIDAFISLSNPLIVDSKWCMKNGLGRNVFKDNDSIEFWDNYQSLLLEESEGKGGH